MVQEDIFLMFYASVAMLSLIACCYLLFRRANAIAPEITSPVRLRRWTAAFFVAMTLCHLWYQHILSPSQIVLDGVVVEYALADGPRRV